MKTFLSVILVIFLSIIAQAQAKRQKDAPTEQECAVKAELDKATRAYDEKRFADAQQHAEQVLQMDSSNKDAPFILARSIRAQFSVDSEDPQNADKARQAIAAYQRISIKDPANDEAYQAVIDLYAVLNEDVLQYSWAMQRALSAELPVEKRVGAYIFLARTEFDCSSTITTENKYEEADFDGSIAVYKMPEERKDFERAQQCVSRGMSLAESAIALQPENEMAWSTKAILLIELAKLAEMEGKETESDKYRKQAGEAEEREVEVRRSREAAALARAVTIDCGELCSAVISAPLPPYPPIARAARADGTVIVRLTIDEGGRVSSAAATSGHPLLRAAAVQAAYRATFHPKIVSGQAVTATGTLTYNFTLPPAPPVEIS